MANAFSLIFVAALALMCLLRVWLTGRQVAHVLAHRGAVPANFAGRIDLTAHQKAADYTLARTRFGRLALAVEVATLLLLTLGGGVQAIHAFWSARLDGLPYGVALICSVLLVSALVDLPLAIYRQFVIEAHFGFNRMSVRLFIADLARQAALAIVVGGPALFAVLWLMTATGALWWLAVWLFWCAFNLLLLFVFPAWIAPLFNRFVPLDDLALKARIDSLLARCGFASSGVFVMDGSKRSTHGNAYFTGYGRTKRIVFFDTLLGRLQPAETEAVLAHELGHFRHRHVVRRIALAFLLSLLVLAILGELINAQWFYRGLGVTAQNDAIGLTLFLLAGPAFIFPLTPLLSMLSRRDEFQADRYAAAQTSAGDLVSALVKLYEDNATTLTPDPLYSLFYDSHPPAALRIARLQEA